MNAIRAQVARQPTMFRRSLQTSIFALLIFGFPAASAERPKNDEHIAALTENAIILPQPIADPIEPVNRSLWALNQGLLTGVVQPSSTVYRWIVPTEVRRGIRNFGRNLGYPRNVLNNLLQQKWEGARDETYRFLLNSVGGIGGLFDVATPSGIPSAENDFGLTLRDWGWRPRIYLMLPIFGPSNERDALGAVVDRVAHPLFYISPFSYIGLGITYNNLTDTVDEYIRVAKSDFDPYYVLRYAWILRREAKPLDMTVDAGDAAPDVPSLETLQSVFFKMRDTQFPRRGEKRWVKIAQTGKELPFTLWLQQGRAPVVFIIPGFGGHRLSAGTVALAEVLYEAGFSVLSLSSPFNYEFMERAASTELPGYSPVDAADLRAALTLIDANIQAKYPDRIGARALLGYSMGGFESLYLAGSEPTNKTTVKFDRYVAVDVPVRLDRAISTLDEHFQAAAQWPAEERTAKIERTFNKVALLASKLNQLTPGSPIPLSGTESKFLVGLAFRISLRDVIFLSQSRTNLGVLTEPINKWRREPVYREIFQYSFSDYLQEFVTPYYRSRGINLGEESELREAVDLRIFQEQFQNNGKVRVIVNANDLLLGEENLAWLKETFADRLTVFPGGGHLGNLNQTVVQREIVRALNDLKDGQPAH